MSTSLRTPMSLSLQGRIPSHMNKFHLQGESVRAILCLLCFVVSQQWLLAGQYAFTPIADSSDPLFSSFAFNGTPAINNDGVVVFGATLTDGGEGIFAANGGTLTMLVDTSGPLSAFIA